MKKITFIIILSFIFFIPLCAEPNGVNTVNLDNIEPGKLRAGLELGWPVSGVTAGYHITDLMEVNVTVGSLLQHNSFALGGSLLFTLVNLEVEDQKLPLNVGPLAYVAFTGNDLDASVGAITRLEYDFNFPLNLYFQAGMVVNIGQDSLFSWPFALGARYIF